jgi:hypothetical protein
MLEVGEVATVLTGDGDSSGFANQTRKQSREADSRSNLRPMFIMVASSYV